MTDSPDTSVHPPRLFTVEQVARAFSLDAETVRRMIKSGRLPGVKLSDRTLRVPADALAATLDNAATAGTEQVSAEPAIE